MDNPLLLLVVNCIMFVVWVLSTVGIKLYLDRKNQKDIINIMNGL
jgi:hypothetical protein